MQDALGPGEENLKQGSMENVHRPGGIQETPDYSQEINKFWSLNYKLILSAAAILSIPFERR